MCKHLKVKPTGELRALGGCKDPNNPKIRPVVLCECGEYLVQDGTEFIVVPATPKYDELLKAVKTGSVNKDSILAAQTWLTAEQRDEIMSIEICEHEFVLTSVVKIYKCKCGLTNTEVENYG